MHVTRVGLCSALAVVASHGADITWDGDASGQNGKNLGKPDAWAGGALPGSGDNAVSTGIHSPGGSSTLAGSCTSGTGVQAITGSLAMGGASIFEWDVSPAAADSVTAAGPSITSGAVFKVLEQGITDTFWNTARSWTVFAATTTGTFGLFGNDGYAFSSRRTTAGEGHFDLSHSVGGVSMSWTPVPELSNALAGALLAGGLLRRNRRWIAAA